ncbi:hypothetical protein Tco_0502888 [Tanacetum coccineum]
MTYDLISSLSKYSYGGFVVSNILLEVLLPYLTDLGYAFVGVVLCAHATIYAPPGFSYNQLAIMEQKKADERMLKLADDQKVKPYWNGERNTERKLETILT